MFHLTQRVAWHDNKWNGTVCQKPSLNSFCVCLDRIREEKNETEEDKIAGRSWSKLDPDSLPPCKAEAGGFMNAKEWSRVISHPYRNLEKTKETHGHLKERTVVKVPPYTTFAVPFGWMLSENQKKIDASLPTPLPPDNKAPFPSPWVFGAKRQEAISKLMFNRLTREQSLIFYY